MQALGLDPRTPGTASPHLWRIAEVGNPNSSDPPYRLELLEFDGEFAVQATFFGRAGGRGPKQWRQEVLVRTSSPWYAVEVFQSKLDERLAKDGHVLLRAEGDGPDIDNITPEEAAQAVSEAWKQDRALKAAKQRLDEIKAKVKHYCTLSSVSEVVSPDGIAFQMKAIPTTRYVATEQLLQLLIARNLISAVSVSTTEIREAIRDGLLTEEEVLPYRTETPSFRTTLDRREE